MATRRALATTGLWTIVMVVAGTLALGADPPGKSGLAGEWQGAVKAGAVQLRLLYKFQESADGQLSGALVSVDQGNTELPFDVVTFQDGRLTAEIKRIRLKYEGKLSADGKSLEGSFTQLTSTMPLVLKRNETPFKLTRPQEPKPPYPYGVEEVTFENTKGPATLAGTLTLPDGAGPWPAVVLISGSGPQDRDEALLGHRPFWVLADYLSRHGIAVLRYDDRGVSKSTGNFAECTTLDFKDDALAAVAFLKSRTEIDLKKIGLCGHSEGGLIAPMAAVESSDIRFIVLMAGPGVTGEEILYLQGELIAKATGADEKAVEAGRALQRTLFGIVKNETDPVALKEKLKAAIDATLTEKQRNAAGAGAAIDNQIAMLLTPWFRYFLTYDPHTSLEKVTCPVLAVNGEKDLQVPPSQNLPEIRKALTAAGNKDFTLAEMPALNHLFQTCTTGGTAEYGTIEETISPTVLDTISAWIKSHTR
jgi:pimeloyl-ACP methyl ester carboxylesterase